jgi:hypothetical protein
MQTIKPNPNDAWAAAKLARLLRRCKKRVAVAMKALQFIEEDWL